ncbi:MAG: 2-hydroxyacyl-CoA dehydratase family protein [Desulfomonilaceae bacterium]|nr:2-hydroxyacyl-CoA dehydratase family protein [Desulfomonilaceae bacterium]
MNGEHAWKPFRETVDAPMERARAWKEQTGGKVIGHLLPDVPEEIIHAAGALPTAVEGAGTQGTQAQAHIPGYTCSHAMGAIEQGMRHDLDILDGMIIPYVCDTTRNLFHIWNHCFPNKSNEFLRLPKRLDYPGAAEYLKAEFSRLADSLCNITGRPRDDEDLAASIALYDRSRAALRNAYRKQREQPAVWTSERVQTLFKSAAKAPREDHLRWMEALPWDEQSQDAMQRVPIYVRGKVWDPPGILDLFDKIGLLVVEDEMTTGYRGVATDAGSDGDPIDVLVRRHLSLTPYTGYHQQPDKLVSGFLERVQGSGAQGVIFLNPKFCEAAGFDTPDFQKALENAGIPSLVLESSSRGVSLEQIRVRVEAFREMIAEDLP